MSPTHVVLEGTLKPDGTLELDAKPALPPGRVQVIVQPLPELPKDDPFWGMMQRIWDGQKARGQVARTREEIDAEISGMREEAQEEMQQAERLYEECRSSRPQARPQSGEQSA